MVTLNGEPTSVDAPPALVARIGTFYFVIDEGADVGQMFSDLCKALREDNRVIEVKEPEHLTNWDHLNVFHPVNTTDPLQIILGSDRAYFGMSRRPVRIRPRVPKKNQPLFRGEDDIPAEEYLVLWDGQTIAVAWEQSADVELPHSGGHVAEDVLRQAAQRAGGRSACPTM